MKLNINGQMYEIEVDPWRTLLDVLRFELGFKGAKEGCGTGSCGSCTVLLDGKAINACLVFVAEVEGKEIMTIEGLSQGGKLHPLQQAFIDEGAVQCGFCTPGMIMTAKAMLDENPNPTRDQVKEGLGGNLCRCTGYVKIIDAAMAAADTVSKGGI